MHINLDNYEQYFLDHAEGNLSPEMERELAEFLGMHPDLKSQLDNYDPTPLEPSPVANAFLKNHLKKNIHNTNHIDENNVDEWMIREMESNLDEDEKTELEEFLALNPAYQFDRKLFALTRLQADSSIKFTKKELLKKEAPVLSWTRFAWAVSSAAAAVILIFIGFRFFQHQETNRVSPFTMPAISWAETSPGTRNTNPGTRNTNPGTRSAEPGTRNPEHGTRNAEPESRQEPFRMESHNEIAVLQAPEKEPVETLVALDLPPVLLYNEKEKPLIARVFRNMWAQAKDAFTTETPLNDMRAPEVNFWTIAEAGVKGYNTLSDRDLELYVHRDNEGNVTSYALMENDRLLLSRERNK